MARGVYCTGCKVAKVVSEVVLTSGDWEVDSKQVSALILQTMLSCSVFPR